MSDGPGSQGARPAEDGAVPADEAYELRVARAEIARLAAALAARDAEIERLAAKDRRATSEALSEARKEIAELRARLLPAPVAPAVLPTAPRVPATPPRADLAERRRVRELEQVVSALRVGLDATRVDIDRAAASKAWRYGHFTMKAVRLLTFRRDRTDGALVRASARIEQAQQAHGKLSAPGTLSTPRRRRELERTAATLSAGLAEARKDVQRAADSRAWRYGHGATRLLRRVTFRRTRTQGALVRAVDRIDQVQRATRALPAGGAIRRDAAERDGGELPRAPEAPPRDVDTTASDLGHVGRAVRERLGPLPEQPCPPVSIVLVGQGGSADPATAARHVRTVTDYPELEVVVGVGSDFASAASAGAARASHDLLLFLDPAAEPVEGGWLRELVAVDAGSGAIGPVLVDVTPDGGLVTRGTPALAPDDDGPVRIRTAGAGEPLLGDGFGVERVVPAVPVGCVLVARSTFEAQGGFPTGYHGDAVALDFGLGLGADGGRSVVVGRSVVAAGPARPVDPDDDRLLQERWGPRLRREHERAAGGGRRDGAGARAADALRVGVKIGAPDLASGRLGGDLHFAEALARALGTRGHHVRIDARDRWEADEGLADDVVVHLRGRSRHHPKPGQFNVLWCISHPDELRGEECDGYDLVCVASRVHAPVLAARTSTPVAVLEQATDPEVFRPQPDPALARDLAYVANSRGEVRPIVRDLLPTTFDLGVWGGGWEGVVDARHLVADHVPNERLRAVYSSARIVLADHWADMREHGFVSNRVYDALACGAFVISDDVAGLRDRFPGAVRVYTSPEDLQRQIRHVLSLDPAVRERESAIARTLVLERETFVHRADRLLELIALHRENRLELVDGRAPAAGAPVGAPAGRGA